MFIGVWRFFRSDQVTPTDRGKTFVWHDLYGMDAYHRLQEFSDNPFLACPLNASLYYIADKNDKMLRLHRQSFDLNSRIATSQEEVVEKDDFDIKGFSSLVVENARLYDLSEERAQKLERANEEINRLKGIIPICATCKSIRHDNGYWQEVEQFMRDHSGAEFSHGLCPECYKKADTEIDCE